MTRRRSDPAQQGPPDDRAGLPQRNLSERRWFRQHEDRPGEDRGCWYFASIPSDPARESGRFDLRAPDGTCYFGATEQVAAMERVGVFTAAHKPVPIGHITNRLVTCVSREQVPTTAVDLGNPDATYFGVTGELFTMSDYGIPQEWARALHSDGHQAIAYGPRFTPGGRALAVFGPGGPAPRPIESSSSLPDVLTQLGVRIAPPPHSKRLTIIDP